MKILLYNPDNGVTQNFMPHLWMFLLQSLTPPGHEVLLIDGNTQPMTDDELVQFALDQQIGLVGIGAMTRMIAKAYRVADALRAAGIRVVMGGPHVTEVPDEALGRDGGPRHADAIALGEADETWPRIVADAARGRTERSLRAGGRVRAGTASRPAELSRHSVGIDRHASSSTASPAVVRRCHATIRLGRGRPSTSSRSNRGAAALTAASSARSRASSATRSASAPTRASWTRCCG